MKLYRIKDWEKHYEVSDSRKVDGPLQWVPVRTKTDGFGYLRITQERDRTDLLAAWYLMLGLAAKQPKCERGKLSRDGIPLTADDMELLTRFPANIFVKALAFFSDAKQGWIVSESIRTDPDASGQNPAPSGGTPPTGQDSTVQYNTEQRGADALEVFHFPENLKSPEFQAAWKDWMSYRTEEKLKAYKPKTITAQLAKLSQWGEAAAIEAIRDSIRQQWQGLFEPKSKNGGRAEIGGALMR